MLALTMGATCFGSVEANSPSVVASTPQEAFNACKWLPERFAWFDAERDNAENPYIQEFDITLRMQYQLAYIDPAGDNLKGADIGNERNTNNEWRRFRLGAKAKLFNTLKAEINWNIGGLESRSKFSDGVWNRSETSASLDSFSITTDTKPVAFKLGKMKPAYLGEYRTSSSKIKTLERSAIVNQLTADKNWGVMVASSDKKADFGWNTGLWVTGVDDDSLWLTPEFNSDTSAMFGASFNMATGKKSRLYFDYMHSFAKTHNGEVTETGSTAFTGPGAQDVFGINWESKQGDFYFLGELIGGFNVYADAEDNAENVFGVVLMPTYRFSPHFEGVLRYQLSSGSNAAKAYSRYYTTNADTATADLLQALYMGVNYYVCPEKPDMMKIMTGIEYMNSQGRDHAGDKGFTGWAFSTAFRANF